MTDLHGEVPGVLPSHPCLIARHRLGLGLPDEVHVGCELRYGATRSEQRSHQEQRECLHPSSLALRRKSRQEQPPDGAAPWLPQDPTAVPSLLKTHGMGT